MRMDKLTNQLQTALADAQSLAVGRDHNFIEPIHLLSALLDQQGGSARPLLQKAGANLAGLKTGLKSALEALPTVSGTGGDVHMSNDLGRILNVADKLAQQGGDTYISSELVLLALLESKTSAGELLKSSRVTPAALKTAIDEVRGGEAVAALAGVAEGEGVFVPGLHVGQRGLGHPGARTRMGGLQRGRAAAMVAVQVGMGDVGQRPALQQAGHTLHRIGGVLDVAGVDDAGRLPGAHQGVAGKPTALQHMHRGGQRAHG